MAMSVKLLDEFATDLIFKNDEIYQALKQQRFSKNGVARDVKIEALEIKYGGTTNAAFTELGTAAPNAFNGSAFEKTTILFDTRVNTPGSSYIHFYPISSTGVITQRYVYFTKYEVFTVVCLAKASIVESSYFTFQDSEGAPTSYYLWFNKGAGVDPTPGGTGIEADVSGATTADDVGVIVAGLITALAGCGSANSSGTVTTTMATKGNPTDAVDVDTTFVITVTEAGGADPGVAGTGAECDIKAATTAANVATIVQGVIDALGDITAAVATATVTITNDEIGLVTAITDGGSGATITQVEQSANLYAGAPLYIQSAQANDTDAITGDMRKDTIFGFAKDADGIPYLTSEEMLMAGATVVKTAILKWIRLIHHKGTDWGSGGSDALGNVTVENVDGLDYQVILATFNESEGGVIWIPNGYHCMIAEAHLKLNDIVQAVTDGGIVKFVKSGFDETQNNRLYNLDPDNPDIPIIATTEHPTEILKWLTKSVLHGTDVAKLTIQEAGINNTPIIEFKTYILLWYQKDYTT